MHLHEPILVGRRRGSEEDEKDEVVVELAFGALAEVLGVLYGKWVEAENASEKVKVLGIRLVQVEPEELAAVQPSLNLLRVENLSRHRAR